MVMVTSADVEQLVGLLSIPVTSVDMMMPWTVALDLDPAPLAEGREPVECVQVASANIR
jgi:hypothetical protein